MQWCHYYRGLTNLIELDLTTNSLRSVPRFAPSDCRHLMRLSLRSNPIVRLPTAAFEHTPDLVVSTKSPVHFSH